METSGGIAKCWLFSQARRNPDAHIISLSAYTLYYALSDAQYYFIHTTVKLFLYRHVFYFMYMVTVIFSGLQHACASGKSETRWAIHYYYWEDLAMIMQH